MSRATLAFSLLLACSQPPPECGSPTDSRNCGRCGNTCAVGSRCELGVCRATCSGLVCAAGTCVDPLTDPSNCGACGVTCAPEHAAGACAGGACTRGPCELGWFDCDGLAVNGCESPVAACTINACPPGLGSSMSCDLVGLSADGRRVALLVGTVSRDLFLFEAATRTWRRLTDLGPDGTVSIAFLSGDGTRIAFGTNVPLLGEEPADPTNRSYILDLETGLLTTVPMPLPENAHATQSVRWSHNGRYLAMVTRRFDGHYFTVWRDLATGASVVFPDDRVGAISGDGQVLSVWHREDATSQPGEPFLIPVDGGARWQPDLALRFTPSVPYAAYPPRLSFDGSAFALETALGTADGGSFGVYFVYAGTREGTAQFPDGGESIFRGSAPSLSDDGHILAFAGVDACAVVDLRTGEVLLESRGIFGYCWPLLSGDGRTVAFTSGEQSVDLHAVPRAQ